MLKGVHSAVGQRKVGQRKVAQRKVGQIQIAQGKLGRGKIAQSAFGSRVGAWYRRRPFLGAWAALAFGMAVVVVVFGRDTGLTFTQHALLAVLAVPLAGACTWIASLEDGGAERTADGPC